MIHPPDRLQKFLKEIEQALEGNSPERVRSFVDQLEQRALQQAQSNPSLSMSQILAQMGSVDEVIREFNLHPPAGVPLSPPDSAADDLDRDSRARGTERLRRPKILPVAYLFLLFPLMIPVGAFLLILLGFVTFQSFESSHWFGDSKLGATFPLNIPGQVEKMIHSLRDFSTNSNHRITWVTNSASYYSAQVHSEGLTDLQLELDRGELDLVWTDESVVSWTCQNSDAWGQLNEDGRLRLFTKNSEKFECKVSLPRGLHFECRLDQGSVRVDDPRSAGRIDLKNGEIVAINLKNQFINWKSEVKMGTNALTPSVHDPLLPLLEFFVENGKIHGK